MTRIKVEGLRELERELAKLANPAARKASARRALKKVAAPIAAKAQANAPRLWGDLAQSIHAGTRLAGGDSGKQAYAAALRDGGSKAEAVKALRDARRADSSFVSIHVGPGRNPQALTQEFGTSFHAPQPFMRPAWDEQSGSLVPQIAEMLAADIVKTAARAARKASKG